MISLEDNVGDIIGKAQRGLGISDSELEKKAGVDLQTIRKLREGNVNEQALQRIAPVLGLCARKPARMFLRLPANLLPARRPSTKESTSISEIWKLIHG